MVALVGAATYYTATVIVKVLVAATGKGKRGRNRADLNYDALGQAAFGRPGQLLSGGVQIAELSLAAVAILCLLGDNLAQLSGARNRSTCRLAQLCAGPIPALALAPHLVLDPRPTPRPDRRAPPNRWRTRRDARRAARQRRELSALRDQARGASVLGPP